MGIPSIVSVGLQFFSLFFVLVFFFDKKLGFKWKKKRRDFRMRHLHEGFLTILIMTYQKATVDTILIFGSILSLVRML